MTRSDDAMALQLKPPLPSMEARSVGEIPVGDEWQYEPKWDGFRCIAFRDGIMAKKFDAAYASGERTGMVKIKQIRTADCVIGGFRYASGEKLIGSLLLGLYDSVGLLHHVDFTSPFKASERRELTRKFEALKKPPGFTDRAPGGPSRWSTKRGGKWEPVDPKIVVEVTYDHFTGGRFRHGTKIVRWRSDKAPKQCTMDQVEHREGKSFALL
jgi:ATP-dependent DNA ligase